MHACGMKNVTKNTTFFYLNFYFKAEKKGHVIDIYVPPGIKNAR